MNFGIKGAGSPFYEAIGVDLRNWGNPVATISNNTDTVITWDTAFRWPSFLFETVTANGKGGDFHHMFRKGDPTKVWIPASGLWFASIHDSWDYSSSGGTAAWLTKTKQNGVEETLQSVEHNRVTGDFWSPINVIGGTFIAEAGDFVRMKVKQTTGGNFNLLFAELRLSFLGEVLI